MGWFADVCNAVGDLVTEIVDVSKAALVAARKIAAKAIDWLAEKAEQFVDGVKRAWQTVKPHVDAIRQALRTAASVAPIPWLSEALIIIDQALGALVAFENSPIAKLLDQAIKWAIELAKRWKDIEQKQAPDIDLQSDILNATDLRTAKQHQRTFRAAEQDTTLGSQRKAVEIAAAINDFEIAQTELLSAINGEPANFEHYLRLRATQKLLGIAEKQLRAAKTASEIGADDLFIVRIASDLIKADPELSQESAIRLDNLLQARYGKRLTPFIFEELIASWAARAEALKADWDVQNQLHATKSAQLKRLTVAKKIQHELSPLEAEQLETLQKEVPAIASHMDDLATREIDIARYAGAAEGFLQLLEKSIEQIKAADREYLIDDGAHVGRLLIDCAEHDRSYKDLSSTDQSLINNYANVFKQHSRDRMRALLTVPA
jgi:hypothetical protein